MAASMYSSQDDDRFSEEEDEFVREYIRKMMSKRKSRVVEFEDEEELIGITERETILLHFYKDSFKKCQVMNSVMDSVSSRYPEVIFGRVRVEAVPRMCSSLNITTLPYLAFFSNGYFVDHVVGFEKLGNRETISDEDLESYLQKCIALVEK